MTAPQQIVLIANFPPDRQESMQRFAQTLADGLRGAQLNVDSWCPRPRFARLVRYRYSGLPKFLGYFDKFVLFPREIRRRRRHQSANTVYHIIDHSNAVYAPHFEGAPLVLTCHDLLQVRSALGEFPDQAVSGTGRRYQEWILKSLRTLRHVACVSQKTRDDLQRLAGLPDSATAVIHNGLNYPYAPLAQSEAVSALEAALEEEKIPWPATSGSAPAPFFFAIGGAQWYKNRTGLLRIFAELRKHAGVPDRLWYVGPDFGPAQQQEIARHQLGGSVFRIPRLSNRGLQAAYSLAGGLIFPSWEEGFGWPVAEAQACGCPVFTSSRPPLSEVGGDAAVYFDPANPVAAANVIAHEWKHRTAWREAGLRRAARWSTGAMIEAYVNFYNKVAKESRSVLA